jgi:hypothetical protein
MKILGSALKQGDVGYWRLPLRADGESAFLDWNVTLESPFTSAFSCPQSVAGRRSVASERPQCRPASAIMVESFCNQPIPLTSTLTIGFSRRPVDGSSSCNWDDPRNAKNFAAFATTHTQPLCVAI